MTPTLCLDDPPELDGKGDAVEEGGGEADDDGGGEKGAAAAGVQEGHPQRTPQRTPQGTPQNFQNFPNPQSLSLTVQEIQRYFATFPNVSIVDFTPKSQSLPFQDCFSKLPQPLVLLSVHHKIT